MVRDQGFVAPLSFTNIYETAKVNDPIRRANLARVQSLISGGQVFRGSRRLLKESLTDFLCARFSLKRTPLEPGWYLSELWFESVSDYLPRTYGIEIPESILGIIRSNPAEVLFNYLAFGDETIRSEAVRRFSASTVDLLARIEARRGLAAGETLAMRRRAYGAHLILDEIDFILKTAQQIGLKWATVLDIGSSVIRSLLNEVAVFSVERELSIRLEDQLRPISENDLRDMLGLVDKVAHP